MTWDTLEGPVLESIADLEPTNRDLNNDDIATSTGFDRDTIDRALLGLLEAEPPYITGTNAAGEELCYLIGVRLTERGRRTVGVWPTEDSGEALLELLAARVAAASTPEERSRWERVFDATKPRSTV
jgi:hypothetical protein